MRGLAIDGFRKKRRIFFNHAVQFLLMIKKLPEKKSGPWRDALGVSVSMIYTLTIFRIVPGEYDIV